nr:nif-specific regulatory protein-like isoform X2 [Macaca fascicularis]
MALLGSLAPLRSQFSVSAAPIDFAQQPLRVSRGGKAPRCSPGQHRPFPQHLLRRLSSSSRPQTPCLPSLVPATTRTYRGRHAAAGSARSEAEPGLRHPPAPGSLQLPPPARCPRRDPAHCGPLRPPPRPGGRDLPPGQGDVASGEPPQPKENAEMQSARRRHLKEEQVSGAARL